MHSRSCSNRYLIVSIIDIRTADLVQGRSINLALSVRGRKALAQVGLEEKLLEHGIPMRGRMLHDLNGERRAVPYDPNTNQVRKHFVISLNFNVIRIYLHF